MRLRPVIQQTTLGLMLLLLILYALTICICKFYTVQLTSMSPTLSPGQHLLVLPTDIIGKHLVHNVRGDIVVVKAPTDNGYAVKRLIGLPGEYISIYHGTVLINGRPLIEPYSHHTVGSERNHDNWPVGPKLSDGRPFPIKISSSSVFVLGDNRDISTDSREWGPLPQSAVSGKTILIFP